MAAVVLSFPPVIANCCLAVSPPLWKVWHVLPVERVYLGLIGSP